MENELWHITWKTRFCILRKAACGFRRWLLLAWMPLQAIVKNSHSFLAAENNIQQAT